MGCGGSKEEEEATPAGGDAELVKIPTQKDLMNQMKSKKSVTEGVGGLEVVDNADREYTTNANLREYKPKNKKQPDPMGLPFRTDLAYDKAALNAIEEMTVKKHEPRLFSEKRVGLATVKGMAAHDEPKKENQDCLMMTKLALGDEKKVALLAGVYDGHGKSGRVISHVVARHVAEAMMSREGELTDAASIAKAVEEVMPASDQKTMSEVSPDAYKQSGATGTAAVITSDSIIMGNLGDSRLIVLSGSEGSAWKATTGSNCHTVDSPEEMKRIMKMGGKILYPPKGVEDAPVRVGVKIDANQSLALAMSRSFGDGLLKKVGVIADPEMLTVDITPETKCAVVACDGVCDYVSDAEIATIAFAFRHSAEEAAQAIKSVAAARQDATEDGYRDDTTCGVVFLPLIEKDQGGALGFEQPVKERMEVSAAAGKWPSKPNERVRHGSIFTLDDLPPIGPPATPGEVKA